MKTKLPMLLFVSALLCWFCWSVYGQRRGTAQVVWEYKVVPDAELRPNYDYNKFLNELGVKGWELVAVSGPDSNGNTMMYFKRVR